MLTIRPLQTGNSSKVYSLPNVHGDTLLTTDATGANTTQGTGPASSMQYDPFGKLLTANTLPNNTYNASWAWLGQHQKFEETNFIQTVIPMGDRIYLPGLDRFTQVDPIEGGTPNNYVYPPDPIGQFDLDGNFSIPRAYFTNFTYISPQAAKADFKAVCGSGLIAATCFLPVGGLEVDGGRFLLRAAGSAGGETAGKAFPRVIRQLVNPGSKMCAFGCGRSASEVDHIVPRSRGGNATIHNAQPVCRACNASKGNRNFPKGYSNGNKINWFIKRIFGR